jgi:formylglycine-generating enzyme
MSAAVILLVLVAYTVHLAYADRSLHRAGNLLARQTVVAEVHTVAASAGGFQPTIQNREPAPGPPSKGMAWIPGGEFSMGANDPPDMDEVGMKATIDAPPIRRVYVDGFYADETDVTTLQFG